MTNLLLTAALLLPIHTAPVALFAGLKSTNASPYITLSTVPIEIFKYKGTNGSSLNWKLLYSTNMKVWVEETNFVFDSLFTNVTYKSNKLTGAVTPVLTNIYTNIITVKARALNEFFRVQTQ